MYPMKIQKYKCFGCGKAWCSNEILAICPVCRGKGVKVKEGIKAEDINIPKWDKVIEKAERFIEKSKGI
ncbi:hypothetical protein ES695_00195 [Candidatus Atribacteria bacterium 1244-E10-H5-B2]|nr:MAG: hypothetical protein ES695_00195 [Candidatus Atribacteria bacterium 1244-E10-H5-B2]